DERNVAHVVHDALEDMEDAGLPAGGQVPALGKVRHDDDGFLVLVPDEAVVDVIADDLVLDVEQLGGIEAGHVRYDADAEHPLLRRGGRGTRHPEQEDSDDHQPEPLHRSLLCAGTRSSAFTTSSTSITSPYLAS